MTEIISFGNAMVAHEQGKVVHYLNSENVWVCFTHGMVINYSTASHMKWRIKPEPVKYSVDVWLDRVPKQDKYKAGLRALILGDDTFYHTSALGLCNNHYRITVESVEE